MRMAVIQGKVEGSEKKMMENNQIERQRIQRNEKKN